MATPNPFNFPGFMNIAPPTPVTSAPGAGAGINAAGAGAGAGSQTSLEATPAPIAEVTTVAAPGPEAAFAANPNAHPEPVSRAELMASLRVSMQRFNETLAHQPVPPQPVAGQGNMPPALAYALALARRDMVSAAAATTEPELKRQKKDK